MEHEKEDERLINTSNAATATDETKPADLEEEINYCDKLKGLVWAIIWVAMITLSNTCCQLLQRKIPDFELNTMRYLAGFIFAGLMLIYQRRLPRIGGAELPGVAAFGTFSVLAALSIYTAVTFAPVASAQSLLLTSSTIAGLLIFRVCGDERITVKRVLFATICIVGIVLILQPEFITSEKHESRSENLGVNVTELFSTKQTWRTRTPW